MERSEVSGNEWTIPSARYKTKLEMLIPLSSAAQDILDKTPKLGDRFVFTNDGRRALSSFGPLKSAFDKQCGVTGWVLHDLRRTARTLMSRAGVPSDHAERCLGHVMGGIRATYDRHEYINEKRHAFDALASLIEGIVHPKANVSSLTARGEERNHERTGHQPQRRSCLCDN